MTAYLLTNHLLSFLAPAAVVAVLAVLFGVVFRRFLVSKAGKTQSIWAQTAIVFIVNVCVLLAGVVVFSNDGKMATYAAMVLAAALCQWVLQRGWKS